MHDTLLSVQVTDRQHRLRHEAATSRLAQGSGEQRRWWRRVRSAPMPPHEPHSS